MRHVLGSATLIGLLGSLALAPAPAFAGLIGTGRTVQAFYEINSPGVVQTENESTVAGSAAYVGSLAAPVTFIEGPLDLSTINVNDTQIVITNLASTGTTYCYDGVSVGAACTDVYSRFEFLFSGESILGASIDAAATSPGFNIATFGSHVGLDLLNPNDLLVDVTGANPPQYGQLTLNLSFATPVPPASVPEPASAGLLGAGLLGLVAVRRRRRARGAKTRSAD